MTVVYNPVLRQIGKQQKNADTPSQVLRVFLNSTVGSGTRSGAAHSRERHTVDAARGRKRHTVGSGTRSGVTFILAGFF